MNPQLPHLKQIDLERRHATLKQQGGSPRVADSFPEPPYEILCQLEWREVRDVSRWEHIYGAPKMDRGLYVCQPLFGCHRGVGTNRTPCWLLALRILIGPAAGKILFRTFWLTERAIERSKVDLRRLGLPLGVAHQTVEFVKGGVLAVVDLHWNQDDRDLPYKISSMTSLAGIAALHANCLDYEHARLPHDRAGVRGDRGLPAFHGRDDLGLDDRLGPACHSDGRSLQTADVCKLINTGETET